MLASIVRKQSICSEPAHSHSMHLYTAVAIPVQIQCRMAKLQAQGEKLNEIHQVLDAKVTTNHVCDAGVHEMCARLLYYL